jgi:hypothetical protein
MDDTLLYDRIERERRSDARVQGITRFSSLKSNSDDSAWVCYIGFQNEGYKPTPVAAFTVREFAIALSESLHTNFPPEQVKLKKINLPIDKFVPYLKQGLRPFDVSINKDGSFFEGTDSYVTELDEKTLTEYIDMIDSIDSERQGDGMVSGTFWAYTSIHAEEKAEDMRWAILTAITS